MSRRDPYFIEEYLDSPVLLTPRTQVLLALASVNELMRAPGGIKHTAIKQLSKPEKTAFNLISATSDWASYTILDPDEYPWFFKTVPESGDGTLVIRAAAIASDLISDVHHGIRSWVVPESQSEPKEVRLPDLPASPGMEELSLYSKALLLDAIVQQVFTENASGRRDTCKGSLGTLSWIVAENICLLKIRLENTDKWVKRLITWHQLLLLKDALLSRAQVLSAARSFFPGNPELVDLILKHYKWQELCLYRYGNEGYEIVKCTESLAKAYLSEVSGDPLADAGPYPRERAKVYQKELDIRHVDRAQSLDTLYDELLRSCSKVSLVVELFGLQKMTGHPMIDPLRGGRAVAEYARSPDTTLPQHALQLEWTFCQTFLQEYVRKEGWPNLVFSEAGKKTELYRLFALRARRLHAGSYPLEDWKECEFTRVFEIDYAVNYLELMDDKSISYYRGNLAAAWDDDVEPTSHRRLLLEMLSRDDLDMKEIAHRVMRRQIPLDWLVVCLYPKEREFKLSPRMFAMMVIEMRTFFAMHEMNLADNILPYIPELTMTKSQGDVSKIFLDLTKPIPPGDILNVFIEFDFKKWNSLWRKLAVHAIGRRIDTLHDSPGFFSFVHDFFENCLMVVRTRELRPLGIETSWPPETLLAWYKHIGGCEGIVQKKWSIATSCEIKWALRKLAVSFKLVGQGDNQVVSAQWKSPATGTRKENLVKMKEEIVSRVAATCRLVHQELNPDECLESTTVITFSKNVYVGGVYYPTSLKFHSRLFPHASQDFPSIRANLGAIYSTATAGAERTMRPLMSLYLAHLQGALYLLRVFKTGGLHKAGLTRYLALYAPRDINRLIKYSLVLPSDLGGFPIAPWTSFVYKGGSDPLGKSLGSLTILAKARQDPLYSYILNGLEDDSRYTSEASAMSLILDPYSIPLRAVATPTDIVSKETIFEIEPMVENKDVHQLLTADVQDYAETLAQDLVEMSPFNPLIARDIFDCSVAGIARTLQKMFTATRTIQAAARRTNKDLVPKVITQDLAWIHNLLHHYSNLKPTLWRERPLFEFTEHLRSKWGLSLLPVPQGMTTYLPFDTKMIYGSNVLHEEGIHAIVTSDKHTARTTRGPYDPYLGGKTREKRSEHGYKIVSRETSSASLEKLQLILSQTSGRGHIVDLIDKVGLSRSNLRLSSVSTELTNVEGGTPWHRYSARAGHQSAYAVGSPTFASHCLISSDNSGPLSGGMEDYPVMYNEHYLAATWVLENVLSGKSLGSRCVCSTVTRQELRTLPTDEIGMALKPRVPILRFTLNPLAFIPRVRFEQISGLGSFRGIPMIGLYQVTKGDRLSRENIIRGWFRDQLRNHSLARVAADDALQLYPIGQLDIAEILSIGIATLVRCSGATVLDSYYSDTSRILTREERRWNVQEYINSVSSSLVASFSYALGHPLLNQDPFVRKHHLYPSPRYAGRGGSLHAKVTSFVSATAIDLFELPVQRYYRLPVVLFSSSHQSHFTEAVLVVIMKTLRNHERVSGIRRQEIRKLMDRMILPCIRASLSTEAKMFTLRTIVTDMRRWAHRRGAPLLASDLALVQEGKLIIHYSLSAQEAVKSLRKNEIVGNIEIPRAPRLLPGSIPGTLLSEYKVKRVGVRTYQGLTEEPERGLEYWVDRFLRHSSERGPPGALHVPIWLSMAPLLDGMTIFLVGSGYGATASAAILAGALHVYGLDLSEDLPLLPQRFLSYKPFLINVLGIGNQYTQSTVSFTSSGNWKDKSVANDFLKSYPSSSTLILDIEERSIDSIIVQMNVCTAVGFLGAVMVRMLVNHSALVRLISTLSDLSLSPRVFLERSTPVGDEVVLYLRRLDRAVTLRPAGLVELERPTSTAATLSKIDWSDIWTEEDALFSATLGTVKKRPGQSLEEMISSIGKQYTSLTKSESPQSHSGTLTALRVAAVSLKLASAPPGAVPTLLRKWIDQGVAWTKVDKLILAERLSNSLLRHLTGPASFIYTP